VLYFNQRHFAIVPVDARGSGASGGPRVMSAIGNRTYRAVSTPDWLSDLGRNGGNCGWSNGVDKESP